MTESAKTAAHSGSKVSETSLTVRRQIDARPEEVFDAWTSAEAMKAWMRPGDTNDVAASLDVRVGGKYTIDMIGPESTHKHHGEYRVVDRPRKLVFTWNADWIPGGSVVTLEFHGKGGGTELVLTHEGLPDRTSVENHTMGWGMILEKLDASLS
jgi:uncharacterized protein YndB with AHSA1/START domain